MQPGLRRMYKTAVFCALLLFSGCLIEVKIIICETTEHQTTLNNNETTTKDTVLGTGPMDMSNLPTPAMSVPEKTHTQNSSDTDTTSAEPVTKDSKDPENDSSVPSAIPINTSLADDQSNSSIQVGSTTLATHTGTVVYSHSPDPNFPTDGEISSTTAEPDTSSTSTIIPTEKAGTRGITIGIIIAISILIAIILIILLCWALRKKTQRYSFDLYHKSPEDANIPLSSVHEDNENGHISNEKKPNPLESSPQTATSEDSTKAANAADSEVMPLKSTH